MRPKWFFVAFFGVWSGACWAQSSIEPAIRLEQLLPPDAFKASGLQKLTPGELQSLDMWVSTIVPGFAQQKTQGVKAAPDINIESNIDGEYKGWNGATIYRLMNGQVWQQSAYHYHYHYAYAPKVVIYPSVGGYKMSVDGDDDDEDISVQQMR